MENLYVLLTGECRNLVSHWTAEAQKPGNTDDERQTYSHCAERLHHVLGVFNRIAKEERERNS